MPGIDTNQLWTPARSIPPATPDQKTQIANVRAGRYGEQYMLSLVPTKHVLSDEGTYFVATSAGNNTSVVTGIGAWTPGTALAWSSAANGSFSDTTPFIYVSNNDAIDNPISKRLYFDYLKLVWTIVTTSATSFHLAIKTDPTVRQITTNHVATCYPWSPNIDVQTSSIATVYAQNSTTNSVISASSYGARVVATCSMGGIQVVGDEYVIQSGTTDCAAYPGLGSAEGTCPGRKVSVVPPIVVGPGGGMTFYIWSAGSLSGSPTYEFEMGWWER
jgi:hypothetical protein